MMSDAVNLHQRSCFLACSSHHKCATNTLMQASPDVAYYCKGEVQPGNQLEACAIKVVLCCDDEERQRAKTELTALKAFGDLPHTLTLLGHTWSGDGLHMATRQAHLLFQAMSCLLQ